MKLRLYTHPAFEAKSENSSTPEVPNRIALIKQHLEEIGILSKLTLKVCSPCPEEIIRLNHSHEMIQALKQSCKNGKRFIASEDLPWTTYDFDSVRRHFSLCPDSRGDNIEQSFIEYNHNDTPIDANTFHLAQLAAGASVEAALTVWNGECDRAFCLVRPPGHHAETSIPMGYCYFNNIAIAAKALLSKGVKRIAIIDFDVHHGNGTQSSFYDSSSVLVVNIHHTPCGFHPYTSGFEDEKGEGAGLGYTINKPLPKGTTEEEYLQTLEEVLDSVRTFAPEILLVSAGYDGHVDDPKQAMKLQAASYARITEKIIQAANEVCNGKVVFVLEGGYGKSALAHSVAASIRVLTGETPTSIVEAYPELH